MSSRGKWILVGKKLELRRIRAGLQHRVTSFRELFLPISFINNLQKNRCVASTDKMVIESWVATRAMDSGQRAGTCNPTSNFDALKKVVTQSCNPTAKNERIEDHWR